MRDNASPLPERRFRAPDAQRALVKVKAEPVASVLVVPPWAWAGGALPLPSEAEVYFVGDHAPPVDRSGFPVAGYAAAGIGSWARAELMPALLVRTLSHY